MENTREQLLEIWREACRHIEISESSKTIAEMLAQRMPLSLLLVLRLQSDRKSIETVAIGSQTRVDALTMTSAPLALPQWKRMVAWARAGMVARFHRGAPEQIDALRPEPNDTLFMDIVPVSVTGDMLIGPLENTDGPAGLIVLVANSGRDFETSHLDFAQQLLEPFSAALENDRRLQELNALREAAEADRRSLLSRLGRQEVNEEVVGAQTGLKHVIDRVELVAKSDVPVLILGETGTGKEVVSRAIHTRSKRGNGPFIRVNCGAIPAELIDSQLFGHEKGSFTGAAEQHQGWFERADGGTLFLDEIGELHWPLKCVCFEFYKIIKLSESVVVNLSMLMCALWPPRIATWHRWSSSGCSARICGIELMSSLFFCHVCESASKTFQRCASLFATRRSPIRLASSRGFASRLTAAIQLSLAW